MTLSLVEQLQLAPPGRAHSAGAELEGATRKTGPGLFNSGLKFKLFQLERASTGTARRLGRSEVQTRMMKFKLKLRLGLGVNIQVQLND